MIRYVLAFLGLSTGAVAAPNMVPVAAMTEVCGGGQQVVLDASDIYDFEEQEPVEASAAPEPRGRVAFVADLADGAWAIDAPRAGTAQVFGVYVVPAVAADGSDPRADFCP